MGFSYLTFDCYGTLINWKRGIAAALERELGALPMAGDELMAAYLRAEKSEEGEYSKYRDVLKRTFERLAADMHLKSAEGAADRFAASVPDWPAFQDTTASMKRLGEMGFRRYILSNVDDDLLRETVRRNGFEVDGTVTAEEVRSYKPAAAHWEAFLRKTGAAKADVLHVAQSVYHDVLAAQSLEISCAWVNRYREPLPPAAKPAYVTDSLGSLVDLLAGGAASGR
jgi:2-haloalkanoic acid dehalogenase type II